MCTNFTHVYAASQHCFPLYKSSTNTYDTLTRHIQHVTQLYKQTYNTFTNKNDAHFRTTLYDNATKQKLYTQLKTTLYTKLNTTSHNFTQLNTNLHYSTQRYITIHSFFLQKIQSQLYQSLSQLVTLSHFVPHFTRLWTHKSFQDFTTLLYFTKFYETSQTSVTTLVTRL